MSLESLFRFSAQLPISTLVAEFASSEALQGVLVELDRRWLRFHWLRRHGSKRDLDRFIHRQAVASRSGTDYEETWTTQGIEYPDPFEKPDAAWSELAEASGIPASPFVVRLIFRREPATERAFRGRAARNVADRYPGGFDRLGEQLDAQVRSEVRPVAFLRGGSTARFRPVVGGISAGPWGSERIGTLGGVVQDPTGRQFGVTCSHVANGASQVSQPAVPDLPKRATEDSVIGQVAASSDLTPSTGLCNDYTANNEIDASLIALEPSVQSRLEVRSLGPIAGVAHNAALGCNMGVDMVGRKSGRRRLRVTAIAAVYEFRDGQSTYCFRNLIQLVAPSVRFARWTGVPTPVQSTDSGSWITSAADGQTRWAGIAMGSDDIFGFAVPSEGVMSWAATKGYQLATS